MKHLKNYMMAVLLLTACKQEITFRSGEIPETKIVVQCELFPNSSFASEDSLRCFVSSSKFLFGQDSLRYLKEGVSVRLTLNDSVSFAPTLQEDKRIPYFLIKRFLMPKDKISMEVTAPPLAPVRVEDRIPDMPKISDIYLGKTIQYTGEKEIKGISADITIENTPNLPAYFCIRMVRRNQGEPGLGRFQNLRFFGNNEPAIYLNYLGIGQEDEADGFYTKAYFSNASFKKEHSYTLRLFIWDEHWPYSPGTTWPCTNPDEFDLSNNYIVLEALTHSAYKYYMSLATYKGSNGLNADPVSLYSNIQNGLGILSLKCITGRELR